MQLSLSFITAHQQLFSPNHISERIMAHFSAFFTAIFLLICALLIEQFAMAQSYGQMLGNNNNNDEPDYEYRRSPANRGSTSSRNRLSSDQEDSGEDEDMEGNEAPPPGDGIGDIESGGDEDDGGEDGNGGDYRGDGGGDEDNMDEGGGDVEGEGSEDQGMLDPEEEDTAVQGLPAYSQYQYGGLKPYSRAHGQGYRLPGGYDISGSGSFNHLSSPYADPNKMPTLPEKNEDNNEDDDGSGNRNSGDYEGDSGDNTADSPSNDQYDKSSLLETPSDDYNYNDEKYNQNVKKAPDTLVTVQEGNSKQGNFRWRIVQSMNKPN